MRKNKWKGRLAAALAATMVFTMVAPAGTAYAASSLRFDPQLGPDLSHSTYSSIAPTSGRVLTISGNGGTVLTNIPAFSGLPTENLGQGPRPKLPEFTGVNWPGYKFDGWYDSDDKKVPNLPYILPYDNQSLTYKAKWIGDSAQSFPYTVMHYRDLNADRNSNLNGTDPGVWPGASDTQIIKFFESSSWVNQVTTGTPVSAGFMRNIPGYTFESVILKNNKLRAYGEGSGAGTMGEAASVNTTTNAIKGNMPNDDLTVAYRYKPDTEKKFTLRAEYVDTNGASIGTGASSSDHVVESEISLTPPAINAYTLKSASIKTGYGDIDDLAGRGIYSATSSGCQFDSDFKFTGKMPNQPVIVTYVYEIDPNFTTTVVVNTVDNHKQIVKPQQTLTVSPADPVVLEIPSIDGYRYPPNITATAGVSNFNFDKDQKQLSFHAGLTGSTINITYDENLEDSKFWGRVEYISGRNGSLTGDTGTKSFRLGSYPLNDLVADVVPSPMTNYIFDGWYKANDTGTDKVGSKLTGNITLNGNLKLFANFVEDPNAWFDITFQSGSHGSISGTKTLHVSKDTTWGGLVLPSVSADNKYQFEGWFDERGNKIVDSNLKILSNQTYTARFKLIADGEAGLLAIPDSEGSIGSDGKGQITVRGANEARKYVITDEDGKILAFKTGNQAKSEAFVGLMPCQSYLVYEVDESATPVIGTALDVCVDEGKASQPAMTVVPSLGDNYKAQQEQDGTGTVAVKPAVSGMVYAIVDENGNVVDQPGGNDGWLTPSGSPLSVSFKGLEPGSGYTIVAKPANDSHQAEDLVLKGSSVRVPSSATAAQKQFTFQMTGGGYVESVTRAGKLLPDVNGETLLTLKEGDQIKINASQANDAAETFQKWNILLGDLTTQYPTQRTQTVVMSAGNVLIQSVYVDPSSPYATVTVDYTPKNSGFALKTEGSELEQLKADLTDNTVDAAALTAGQDITYTVKFTKRTPIASESNAVKAAMTEPEGASTHWAVDLSLLRKLEGSNKPIPDDADPNPLIQMYAAIDPEIASNLDIQIWGITQEADGGYSVNPMTLSPDPNDTTNAFTGMVAFDAQVGTTYILSSTKTYQVTIVDAKRGTTDVLTVKAGNTLEDADGYEDLAFHEAYIEPGNKQVWINLGLSKTESGKTLYDTQETVTKDLTLYAIYEKQENAEWLQAQKALRDVINTANALSNNSLVSEDDQQALKEAVKEALKTLNSLPQPTLEQLTEAKDALKNLVDNVRNNNPGSEQGDEEWLAAKAELQKAMQAANTLMNKSSVSKDDKQALANAIQAAADVLAIMPCPSLEAMLEQTQLLNDLIQEVKNNSGSGGGNSGGSGGGGSGGSGGGVSGPGGNIGGNGHSTYNNNLDGRWSSPDGGQTWEFLINDQTPIRSQWINVRFYADGKEEILTYHLNGDGKADAGWYLDTDGKWYYLSPSNDGKFGHMVKGWHLSQTDGQWYYLSELTGAMATGWHKVGAKWYYMSDGTDGRPQGALYRNTTTPDGYPVGDDGAWIKDIPD